MHEEGNTSLGGRAHGGHVDPGDVPEPTATGRGDGDPPRTPTGVAIERLDPAQLDLIEPLWRSMLDHIVTQGSVVPIRPAEDSWPMRRALYAEWLAGPDSFLVVARRGEAVIGYAMVRGDAADPVWYTGGRQAELESLSVVPGERGNGIGTALMDAVDAELARLGIDDLTIGVDSVNPDARRFYESRGYKVGFLLMYGRPGGGRWSAFERQDAHPYCLPGDDLPPR